MHKQGSVMEPDQREPTGTSSDNIARIISIFWTYRSTQFKILHSHSQR